MTKRVGIIAISQESNTFIGERTTLQHFEEDLFLTGSAMRCRLQDSHHEVAGFFEGLAGADLEAVPILAARAMPFGVMTAETFDTLMATLCVALRQVGTLDGLLVAPHGATVSERVADVDGHWLMLAREHLGPHCPILGTLDPHANLSPTMVAACDGLVAYRTNPHVDQRQRGRDAAEWMTRTLAGKLRPTMAAAFPPMAINIECQQTNAPPCLPLYETADRLRQQQGIVSTSICLGFPYADVAEMGSATIAVTNGDPGLAAETAAQLGREMWMRRESFQPKLTGVDEALQLALQLDGPICLLDMGDNVGGGSPGDGTYLLHALDRQQVRRSFVCLYDPSGVESTARLEAGSRLRLSVGGHTDDQHGATFTASFTVVGAYDGRFNESRPRHGGFSTFDQGRTVVLRTDYDLTVMLTSRRMAPWSLEQLRSCGLDPGEFRILVAKGVHAPVAAYQEVCRHCIRVNTPGVTSADLTGFDYRHRRRPMFLFEPDATWENEPAVAALS